MKLHLTFVLGLLGLFAWVTQAQVAVATPPGTLVITDFGAVGDSQTDNTAAIQSAIDKASVAGGIVLVPPGRWLCKGHLNLKMGVHLAGVNQAPQSWEPATGSILEPTEGRDNEAAPAFIEMRSSTSVKGLTIYYPEQSVNDIKPYPWTIQIRADPARTNEVSFDSTVENVTLINSYNGICTGRPKMDATEYWECMARSFGVGFMSTGPATSGA